MALSDYGQTIRGEVMHDLGQWAEKKSGSPTLAISRRFTAARIGTHVFETGEVEAIAKAAIADWRASQRAKIATGETAIGALYIGSNATADLYGVRIRFPITYDGVPPPGSPTTMAVLINVRSYQESLSDIEAELRKLVIAGMIRTPHGSPGRGYVGRGTIVQVVVGGFAHAQVEM